MRLQKRRVRDFWNRQPCGTADNPHSVSSHEYFHWIERQRQEREPFIENFAKWSIWSGKRVLELGIGAGTDFARFARSRARCVGLDLSEKSVALSQSRLKLERLEGDVLVGDAERLPFPDDTFDFVYSWGVLHHTENTPAAAKEVVRVAAPGGRFCVMLYHRHSLVCLQAYLFYGLLRGRPFRSLDRIAGEHLESPGTKVFSRSQALGLFAGQEVAITHVVTPYDLRFSRRFFLPVVWRRLLPDFLGYFLVVEGRKRDRSPAKSGPESSPGERP